MCPLASPAAGIGGEILGVVWGTLGGFPGALGGPGDGAGLVLKQPEGGKATSQGQQGGQGRTQPAVAGRGQTGVVVAISGFTGCVLFTHSALRKVR